MRCTVTALTASAILSATALPVMADTETLFYCITEDSKELRLLADGDTLIYQYGDDIDTPELELSRQRDEVGVQNVLLPGPAWQQSLTFSNGQYDYQIMVEAHRPMEGDYRDLAGVQVSLNKSMLADKNCTPKNMVQRLLVVEGIRPWGYVPDQESGR
ncbi:hypothetical protein [Marinobacter zhejiangensis]|uniref:Uncharacterized protein n=1 Tax=Marinobacter zhejiangensis TaxID=488535 RepID=A0A1I4LLW2_9GAMM|nr:hypothetical protein [Marinobacter zhejiangensis]SFL91836.1 hypothetical protein SAMN04487963_0541 [Marinobacter zhejiangensis]